MERTLSHLNPLTALPLGQWRDFFLSWGEPTYRARQVARWVFHSPALSFGEMTDLPQALREKLEEHFCLESLAAVREAISADGSTRKALLALRDGRTIEAVLMAYPGRLTVCVSTQVGCPIGCPFCATGQQGLQRNLTPAEIVDQALYFARRCRGQVSNVVFMGMGEPLLNYEATWQAVVTLHQGLSLGARHLTISTAGVVPGIARLARESLPVRLAVSLHAPDDGLRDRLVPLNRRYPLGDLIPACRDYAARTGRRLTFEYVLLAGINDSLRHARALAALVKGLPCLVNLVPANPSGDPEYGAPSPERVSAFQAEMESRGIATTLRARRGSDIAAGCGQLRSQSVAAQIQKQL